MGRFRSKRKRVYRPELLLQQLEERIVLDASVNPAPQDNPTDHPANSPDHVDGIATTPAADAAAAGGAGGGDAGLVAQLPDSFNHVFSENLNVVLISNNLADVKTISDAAQDHATVITYDAEHDNLATITAKLQDLVTSTGHKIDNLAIVGHSSEGILSIGTDEIQFFTLSNFKSQFETLGQTLTEDAQIQFYGCYVAGDVWGEALVDRIAIYTAAETFASTDATGGATHDWTLEHSSNQAVAMNSILDTTALASVSTELVDIQLITNTDTSGNAAPSGFVQVNGHILFAANNPATGTELWEYNPGTNTNTLFMDINLGIGSSTPSFLTVIGNNLYFTASSSTAVGFEPWISDGTAAGTHMIKDIYTASNQGSNAGSYTGFNGEVYFSALDASGQRELFKTDGTDAGTIELTQALNPSVSGANNPIAFNGAVYFTADDGVHGAELWKTNGIAGAETLVTDFSVGGISFFNPGPTLTVFNNELYFVANDGTHGVELWKTDGTNTTMMTDINPNAGSSLDSNFKPVVFNNELYFSANDGTGNELWKTGSTPLSAVKVADINAAASGSFPSNLIVFDNDGAGANPAKLYFTATNGATNGNELWVTDGTVGNATMVADINVGAGNGSPSQRTVLGNHLYFQATDGTTHGSELWRSDGVPVSGGGVTELVTDINPGTNGSGLTGMVNLGGTLYFSATNGASGTELFKSDGTVGNAVLTPQINLLNFGANSPSSYVNVNGQVFFIANDNVHGNELWVTDGTAPGTHMVEDINVGIATSSIASMTVFNNMLYFSATNGTANGIELWKSDGTALGTDMVSDINLGTGASTPAGLTVFDDGSGAKLYFSATDGSTGLAHGAELWRTDGTITERLADINAGTASSSPADLTVFDNDGAGPNPTKLYFAATDGTAHGRELYAYDGTAGSLASPFADINLNAASSNPTNFKVSGTNLFFTAGDATHGNELWKTDGTTTSIVLDINPNAANGIGTNPAPSLTDINGTLFFVATNGADGFELWKSDGTPGGTVMVTDINPGGNAFTGVPQLIGYNGEVYFAASDGTSGLAHGTELWKSDGTAAGTAFVKDINPGSGGSNPFGFQIVNGTLYFRADGGGSNAEIWGTKGTATSTAMVTDFTVDGLLPNSLTAVGNALYFTTPDALNGAEPWSMTDTPATATSLNQGPYTIAEDSGPLNLANIVVTDTDLPGDTITANLVLDLAAAGSFSANDGATFDALAGVWTISGTQAAVNTALANVTFTAAPDFFGTVNITTQVFDNAVQGPADGLITVNVTPVNDAPVNTVPASAAADSNVLTPITGISISDVDAAASVVQVTLSVTIGTLQVNDTVVGGLTAADITGNASGSVVLNGTLAAINATLADATGLQYLSGLNYVGADTLTVLTNDQGATGSPGPLTDTDPVTITVSGGAAVNDPPVISLNGTVQQTDPAGAVVFNAANNNLISVSDVDAGTGLVRVTLTATHGTMTLSGVTGLTFDPGQDGTADATVSFTGTLADVNAALNGMSFNRDAGYTGLADVSIGVNDQGNTGTGGAQVANAVENISVEPYDAWFAGFGTEAGWSVYNHAATGDAYYTHDMTLYWWHVSSSDTWSFWNGTAWVATDALNNAPYADGFGPYGTWFHDTVSGGTYEGYDVFIHSAAKYFSLDYTAVGATFWQQTNAGAWSYWDGSAWYATGGFLVEPVNVWFHGYDGTDAGYDVYNHSATGDEYFTHNMTVFWWHVASGNTWQYWNGTVWNGVSGLGSLT